LELGDEGLEILLIEIERSGEDDEPEYDARHDTEQLMPAHCANQAVIILRKRVYLLQLPFYFGVHNVL